MGTTTTSICGDKVFSWKEKFDNEPGGMFTINNETRTWTSGPIDISEADDNSIRIYAEIEGVDILTMESADYLTLYYDLDNSGPVAWIEKTRGFNYQSYYCSGLSGDTLIVSLEGRTDDTDETYYVDKIRVEEIRPYQVSSTTTTTTSTGTTTSTTTITTTTSSWWWW